MAATSIRLGVDIGGTFTDVVLERDGASFSTKVLTTYVCLLYTSPSPRDLSTSRMPSSA